MDIMGMIMGIYYIIFIVKTMVSDVRRVADIVVCKFLLIHHFYI